MHFKWRSAAKKHEKKKRNLLGYLLGVIPKGLSWNQGLTVVKPIQTH